MSWLLLILSLPTETATARMRAWRALKAQGAAVLRDGVYLMPARDSSRASLQAVQADVHDSGGQAWLLAADGADAQGFAGLFDRSPDFGGLLAQIAEARAALQPAAPVQPGRRTTQGEARSSATRAEARSSATPAQARSLATRPAARPASTQAATPASPATPWPAATAHTLSTAAKQTRQLRKAMEQLVAIDFFPGPAQQQTAAALQDLETLVARLQSPDEPQAAGAGTLQRLAIADFQGRTWATRARPWVDRLACAWLIRRFIDPQARLLWLARPADCPKRALGFDFDGARFSHGDGRCSLETLMASFGLDSPALRRLGGLVHYLDMGGVQPPEAAGIERLLAGLRDSIPDDDQLLAAASAVFDGLLVAFEQEAGR